MRILHAVESLDGYSLPIKRLTYSTFEDRAVSPTLLTICAMVTIKMSQVEAGDSVENSWTRACRPPQTYGRYKAIEGPGN